MSVGSALTALIGFSGVVTGAVISASVTIYVTNRQQEETNRRFRQQQEEANKRLRAEYYMEKKVKAMVELHAELEDCFQTVDNFISEMSRTTPLSEYKDDIEPKIGLFHKTLMKHSIYLTEEQDMALFYMNTQFGLIGADIEDFLTADEEERGKEPRTHQGNLREAWEEAKGVLKQEMDVPSQHRQPDSSDKYIHFPMFILFQIYETNID